VILRGHHGDASRIYPRQVMLEKWEAIKAPKPDYTHGTSFIHACLGNTKTTSPFSVAGELTQVLNLGMIAEFLNVELQFDLREEAVRRQRRGKCTSRRYETTRGMGPLLHIGLRTLSGSGS